MRKVIQQLGIYKRHLSVIGLTALEVIMEILMRYYGDYYRPGLRPRILGLCTGLAG